MVDRQPLHAGRVHLEPVNGQQNTFDMTLADGATEQGTPLNKATFLKDATAALYGLSNTAVPDDVFAWLGRYAEHYWKRRSVTQSVSSSDITEVIYINSPPTVRTIYWSKNLNPDKTLYNPNNISVVPGIDGAQALASLAPCYITGTRTYEGTTYELPAGTTYGSSGATVVGESSGSIYLPRTAPVKAKTVTSVAISCGEWEIVSSTNRSAYPDSGIVDGYEYQYIGVPFDNLTKDHVKIETGSYVGTGTYGASNPNSLTFGFVPKFVFVIREGNSSFTRGDGWAIMQEGMTSFSTMRSADNANQDLQRLSWNNKTVSWYSNSYAYAQLNNAGTTYRYLAIG